MPYAVVDPRTVVVHLGDTQATLATVVRARRLVIVAAAAILQA